VLSRLLPSQTAKNVINTTKERGNIKSNKRIETTNNNKKKKDEDEDADDNNQSEMKVNSKNHNKIKRFFFIIFRSLLFKYIYSYVICYRLW
jgi:hypothetical protein